MASGAKEVSELMTEEKRDKEMLLNKVALFERQCKEMQEKNEREKEMLLNKVSLLESECKDLQEKNEDLEALNQVLIEQEQVYREELIGVRKELINGFRETWYKSPAFGIKCMGSIDSESLSKCSYAEAPHEDADLLLLCAWEEKVRDPKWYPFQIVEVGEGKYQEVLKEDDQLVMDLKNLGRQDLFDSVITALKEINEYNPSGRYLVPELWNIKGNTKASSKEVISYVFKKIKSLKKKNKTLTGALV